MAEEMYATKGTGNAALATGIIGTALGAINWLGGSGGGWYGMDFGSTGYGRGRQGNGYCQSYEGKVSELQSTIAKLEAEKYADSVGIEVYKAGVNNYKELDNKINTNLEKLYSFVIDLDKKTALNNQALQYENTITNNRIDCCKDKMEMQLAYNKQLAELSDAAILSYVNSNFLPGTLKLPITSICPQPSANQ